jgi:hypothetical protein
MSRRPEGNRRFTRSKGGLPPTPPPPPPPPGPSPFDPQLFPNFPAVSPSDFVVNWLAIGDSLTALPTNSPAGPALWTPRCAAQLGTQVKLTNIGKGGQTLLTMIAEYDTYGNYLSQAPGIFNICTIQGGINDVVINQATPGTTTPTTIAASYSTLISDLQTQGWYVIAWNVEASNIWNNVTYGSVDYATTVGLVRTACAAANGFIDIAADSILGPANSYSNTEWYIDNTHKTINGDERKARVLAMPVLNNAIAPSNVSLSGNFVYGIYPNNGPIGASTNVGIRVTNLTSGSTITSVTVGGEACTSISFDYTRNTVFATVPSGSSSGNVVVVINGTTATGGTGMWTANSVPVIASVQPNIILPSTPLTITGDPSAAHFQAGMVPTVQGLNCTSVVIVSTTEITCVAPAGIVPETAGVPLSQVVVSGSPQTSASQVGVVPASVQTLFQVNTTAWNATTHTLKDVMGAITLNGVNAPVYMAGALGGLDGLSFAESSSQSLANNSAPLTLAPPFTHFSVAIVPAWGSSFPTFIGGIAGSNNSGGLEYYTTTLRVGGVGGYYSGTANPAVGYPSGNLFVGSIVSGGATGAISVDGVALSGGAMTGTVTGTGVGIAWGLQSGFYATCTVCLHGIANDALSTAEEAALQWICNQQYGTAYP